jgi:hypothetical protein
LRLFNEWVELELNFHQNSFRDDSNLIVVLVFLLYLLDTLKLYLLKAYASLFLADTFIAVFALFLEKRNKELVESVKEVDLHERIAL